MNLHSLRPLLGPILWIATLQYFFVQLIAMQAWDTSFSLRLNPISDLGNTACAPYGGRFVCSPLHGLMNASFIVLGVSQLLGALLIARRYARTLSAAIGFGTMVLAGFGTILVGLFPENSIASLHVLGAGLPFFLGNLGMIVFGLSGLLGLPRWHRFYSVTFGVITLTALVLFLTDTHLGLGHGGIERVVAYPQTIWLIVTGILLLKISKGIPSKV